MAHQDTAGLGFPSRRRRRLALAVAALLTVAGGWTGAARSQISTEVAEQLPEVIDAPRAPVNQILELGGSLGRYKFDAGGDNSTFNTQFGRYTRTRPNRDWWRFEAAHQGRLDANSLELGATYGRSFGATGVSAGLSGGTSKTISNQYRIGLGVTHPVSGFLLGADYAYTKSHGANSANSWGASVTRWFPHLILGAGYRLELGQPGDTQSSTFNFGATYYVWRKTYLGGGFSFGTVAYQLVGPGAPLPAQVLVDYDSWSAFLALTRYVTDRSGFNARYDHTRAEDIWTIDGLTVSYFREW